MISDKKKTEIFDLIKRHMRGRCQRSGAEIYLKCPFCVGTGLKLYFNLNTSLWWCHRCQEKGHGLKRFLKRIGVPTERIEKLKQTSETTEWQQAKIEGMRKLLRIEDNMQLECKPAPFPERTYRVLGSRKSIVAGEVVEYLQSRGFNQKTMELLDPYVSMSLFNWFILPVKHDCEIVFWQRRTLIRHEPKYLGPEIMKKNGEQVYFGKSDVLWGLDLIQEGEDVVICEGILSAATVVQTGVCAVAIMGKRLSRRQRDLLIEKKPGRIIIALDGWSLGDNTSKWAAEIKKDLYDFFPGNVLIMTLPEGKDPNDLRWDFVNLYEKELICNGRSV